MKIFTLICAALLLCSNLSLRADDMHDRIYNATRLLEKKQGSADPIPTEILAHARGVAIGSITKAGLGIGGQGGEGIVMLH